MPVTVRSFLPFRNIDSLIAALAGSGILLAFFHHGGVGVSPDSVTYISVAANLHDHHGPIDFHGDSLVDFPVLYPFFLSGLRTLTGLDYLRFGPALNALLFGILIFLSGSIMERFAFRSKLYKWILLSFIVLSPCLLEVYSMIWSETLFLLLLLFFIFFSRRYFLSHSLGSLILIALVAGLACLTRYAGITILVTGGLFILCDPELRGGRKIRHLLLFGAIAFFLPALNLYHNRSLSGTLAGHRERGIVSFGKNLQDFGSTLYDWLQVPGTHHFLASLIASAWLLLFIAAFVRRLTRKGMDFCYEKFAIAYFIVYAVFILAVATVSRFQSLDSRLLSPLFLPWLWGSTYWIPARLSAHEPVMRKALLALILGLSACCLTGQLLDDRETWDGVKDAGIPGYTENDWQNSETMKFIRGNTEIRYSKLLYSNANDAIWFLGAIPANALPHKDFSRDISRFLARDRVWVAWFNDGVNPDLIGIPLISQYKKTEAVYRFSDGAVYLFTGK
jgi:hypothetical protein